MFQHAIRVKRHAASAAVLLSLATLCGQAVAQITGAVPRLLKVGQPHTFEITARLPEGTDPADVRLDVRKEPKRAVPHGYSPYFSLLPYHANAKEARFSVPFSAERAERYTLSVWIKNKRPDAQNPWHGTTLASVPIIVTNDTKRYLRPAAEYSGSGSQLIFRDVDGAVTFSRLLDREERYRVNGAPHLRVFSDWVTESDDMRTVVLTTTVTDGPEFGERETRHAGVLLVNGRGVHSSFFLPPGQEVEAGDQFMPTISRSGDSALAMFIQRHGERTDTRFVVLSTRLAQPVTFLRKDVQVHEVHVSDDGTQFVWRGVVYDQQAKDWRWHTEAHDVTTGQSWRYTFPLKAYEKGWGYGGEISERQSAVHKYRTVSACSFCR